MKRFLKQLKTKAFRVSDSKWRLLLLLAMGVVLKSLIIVFWDIGATTLLITQKQLFSIGIDFMVIAFCSGLCGLFLWKADRRQGAGTTDWVLFCTALAAALLYLSESTSSAFSINLLFILKYLFYTILTTSFWATAKRFIQEDFTSLKFLSLFCLELIGFSLAGLLALLCPVTPMALFLSALFALIGLALVFKTIFDLAPLPPETFTRKTDGIQDVFERPLVWTILLLVFCGTTSRVLAEAVLYTKLASTGIMPMTVLGLVWILFGLLGLLMVLVLYHTRYIYTTLAGMIIFGMSIILTGVAAFGRHSGPVATGYLVLLLGSHFYLNGFLHLLPRVLSGGRGTRLKKRSMTTATPLGFILCGSIYLNFRQDIPAVFLISVGVLTLIATLQATVLYSDTLFQILNMRLWRKGPFMLFYRKIPAYLKELLTSPQTEDVIYALRILKVSNHPFYEEGLKHSLRHPQKKVRLFALSQMKKLYFFDTYKTEFKRLMDHDSELSVRNQALSDLILTEAHPQSYLSFLKDRLFRFGAAAGFLEHGSEWLPAVLPTLKSLIQSKNTRDNISVLSLIEDHPYPELTPLVIPLIKNANRAIVRKALLAAGSLQSPQLLLSVLRALDDPDLQEAALVSLARYEKSAFPPIEKMITNPQTPTLRRKQLILFLGSLPSGEGKQILLRSLTIENQKLRKAIAQNILDSAISWTHPDREVILKRCLKQDIHRISWLLHLREIFMNAPTHESEEAFEFLLRALQEDIDDTRELILYQLLILKNNTLFHRAVRVLLTDNYELYLPAIGVIQDLVSNALYQKLKSILILPLAQKHKATLSGLSVSEAVLALNEILVTPPVRPNHWIRSTALYALRRLGSPLGIPAAETALSDTHPIVLEAAVWALVRLQPDQNLLHQKLLTIPTSRLSRLSLDQLLKN